MSHICKPDSIFASPYRWNLLPERLHLDPSPLPGALSGYAPWRPACAPVDPWWDMFHLPVAPPGINPGILSLFADTPLHPQLGLADKDFAIAAQTTGLEVAVIQAFSQVESSGSAFDHHGRPTLRYERHKFHQFTHGVWDVAHPDISTTYRKRHHKHERTKAAPTSHVPHPAHPATPAHSGSTALTPAHALPAAHTSPAAHAKPPTHAAHERERLPETHAKHPVHRQQHHRRSVEDLQYRHLHSAFLLDPNAALQSASYGRFQIMGFNYDACRFRAVDAFVLAMMRSEAAQLAAFTMLIHHNRKLRQACLKKDWATMARLYNGKDYARNHYDVRLREAYARFEPPKAPSHTPTHDVKKRP